MFSGIRVQDTKLPKKKGKKCSAKVPFCTVFDYTMKTGNTVIVVWQPANSDT